MTDGIIQEAFKKRIDYIEERLEQTEQYSKDFHCKKIIRDYLDDMLNDEKKLQQELIEKIKQGTDYRIYQVGMIRITKLIGDST